MILAGDIGGTKTNVALCDTTEGGGIIVRAQGSYPSAERDSLESIIAEFLREHPAGEVTHACFGVAGPVVDERVETTNLAWDVRADSLAAALNLRRVALINDLEATAYGVETLRDEQLHTLNEGAGDDGGHRALIAAGTGLGMAGLFRDGEHYRPMPSEGGHVDYAPRNETEIELMRYMQRIVGGRVSYERVLSGVGLVNVYKFLRDEGYAQEPAWLAERFASEDDAACISAAALAGESELASKALDIFVQIYGATAGNLALLLKPSGGLYVGGGIAPKILEKLKDGTFMRAFSDKGRMSSLIESMPVRVILDDKTALYGAARCALLRG